MQHSDSHYYLIQTAVWVQTADPVPSGFMILAPSRRQPLYQPGQPLARALAPGPGWPVTDVIPPSSRFCLGSLCSILQFCGTKGFENSGDNPASHFVTAALAPVLGSRASSLGSSQPHQGQLRFFRGGSIQAYTAITSRAPISVWVLTS